jgi:seryl-tRNA synthetase
MITVDTLLNRGWAERAGALGTVGLTSRFESVIARLQSILTTVGSSNSSGPIWYPPLISTSVIERAEYSDSFPHLLGTIRAYQGCTEADAVLAPAVCYHIYPQLSNTEISELHTFDAAGYCYRHEATVELGRFRAFRMREFVAVGSEESCVDWRNESLDRCQDLFINLGLKVRVEAATDPFFGPESKLLKATQRRQQLKYEFIGRVATHDSGTAIASTNYHKDHLGSRFTIRQTDNIAAHSACTAFGLERITLALINAHGDNLTNWPECITQATSVATSAGSTSET